MSIHLLLDYHHFRTEILALNNHRILRLNKRIFLFINSGSKKSGDCKVFHYTSKIHQNTMLNWTFLYCRFVYVPNFRYVEHHALFNLKKSNNCNGARPLTYTERTLIITAYAKQITKTSRKVLKAGKLCAYIQTRHKTPFAFWEKRKKKDAG